MPSRRNIVLAHREIHAARMMTRSPRRLQSQSLRRPSSRLSHIGPAAKRPAHAAKPLPPHPRRKELAQRPRGQCPYSLLLGRRRHGEAAPKGEEHRHRRQQSRQLEQKVKRSRTVSRISSYLHRSDSNGLDQAKKWLGRSATMREGRASPPKTGQRKRATTFDEILAPIGGSGGN